MQKMVRLISMGVGVKYADNGTFDILGEGWGGRSMQKMVRLISMGVGVKYAENGTFDINGGGVKHAENGTFDINGGGRELCRIWYFGYEWGWE